MKLSQYIELLQFGQKFWIWQTNFSSNIHLVSFLELTNMILEVNIWLWHVWLSILPLELILFDGFDFRINLNT